MTGRTIKTFIDPRLASRVVAAVADFVVVVDRDEVVVEVSLGDAIEEHPGWKALVGKRWPETLHLDSERKADQLLADARSGRPNRSREMNQKVEGLGEIPSRFVAVALDDHEHVAVLGRDLRRLANLQQRIVDAQQTMDREYGRLRQADTRYRLFFHVTSEGVVVADRSSRKVTEANPAAATMLGEPAAAVAGKHLQDLFEPKGRAAVQDLLAAVDAGARPADVHVKVNGPAEPDVTLSVSSFRQSRAVALLVRFWSTTPFATSSGERTSRLLTTIDAMPEAFVVTGEDRRILCANAAFCEIVRHDDEGDVIGEPIDRWLGRPGVDLHVLIENLREHGTVKNFATVVRADVGAPREALVTAVSAVHAKVPCLGFTIRLISTRPTRAPTSAIVPRSVERLRDLVGRVSLKELVRESADLIERLCIEAALDVSGNNRASAAQLLGLSRQGLYSKLRRHGLAEFGTT
jgi:transcriptional regulator PpsR